MGRVVDLLPADVACTTVDHPEPIRPSQQTHLAAVSKQITPEHELAGDRRPPVRTAVRSVQGDTPIVDEEGGAGGGLHGLDPVIDARNVDGLPDIGRLRHPQNEG